MRHGLPGLLIALAAACASPGVPPGGPVDTEAPKIVRIVPDSGKTATTPREVIFRFDEVVSERPSSVPSLEALFLISPRDGSPKVDWHRNEISVRPRSGWRKNTVYTITLLPGVSDLRGNVRNTGAVTMFATGATIPTSRITGTLFNWGEARAISRAGFVEVKPRDDTTLVYVATTDSTGNFVVPNVPPGAYLVRGISDDNSNRGLDPREPWDSATVTLTDTATVDLYAFTHDSLGARLQSVSLRDSITIELLFDNLLSVTRPAIPANVRVRGSDSVEVGVLSVSSPPPDTTAAARRLKRAVPARSLIVKLARPLTPRTTYRVSVVGIVSLNGIPRSTEAQLTVPAPAPPAAPSVTAPPAASVPQPVKR